MAIALGQFSYRTIAEGQMRGLTSLSGWHASRRGAIEPGKGDPTRTADRCSLSETELVHWQRCFEPILAGRMEILAGLLALLAGLGGGAGYFVDSTARHWLTDELDSADELVVRVQSTPNFSLLGGHIDRIAIAGRGLTIEPYPRLAVLELETDAVALAPDSLTSGDVELKRPLQAAFRVAVTEADVNAALRSPAILEQLQDLRVDMPMSESAEPEVFDVKHPQVDFRDNNHMEVKAQLVPQSSASNADAELEELNVALKTALAVERGQRLRLTDAKVTVNNIALPDEIAEAVLDNINQRLDVAPLQEEGIFLRLLDFQVAGDTISVAGFTQVKSLQGML